MNIITSLEKFFKNFLPSPFSIAILLTLLTVLFAYLAQSNESSNSILEIIQFWERGIWDKSLMVFCFANDVNACTRLFPCTIQTHRKFYKLFFKIL